jgi:chorismate lyase
VFQLDTFDSEFRADFDGNWRSAQQIRPGPDPQWRDWLLDHGSLTRRLKLLSQGTFRVSVLQEGWIRGNAHQQRILGAGKACQPLWSRHVELCLFDRPWVAAHSLIPYSSMKGSLRQLSRLRDKPLGGFLFEQPSLCRSEPELLRIDNCWGRRSIFTLHKRPLIVAEFFLPEMQLQLGLRT